MSEVSLPVRNYIKRKDVIPAVQWDGSLEMVPFIATWLREHDLNVSVVAEFWESGVTLKIGTRGLNLRVLNGDYISANSDGVIMVIEKETFDRLYREEEQVVTEATPELEVPEEAPEEELPNE